MNATGVADIFVPEETGRDILEIRLSESECPRVQLRPGLELTHDCWSEA